MAGNQNSGKKPKINDKLINKACTLLKDGNYVSVVCQALHIAQKTWYDWLKQAREEEALGIDETTSIYCKFRTRIEEAMAIAEADAVGQLRLAGKRNWLATAWFLERRYPKKWGAPDIQEEEVTGIEDSKESGLHKMLHQNDNSLWKEEDADGVQEEGTTP